MGSLGKLQNTGKAKQMFGAVANIGKARRMIGKMASADLTDVAESLIASAGLMGNRQVIRLVLKQVRRTFKKQAKRLIKEQKPVTAEAIMEFADKDKRAFEMFERQLGVLRADVEELAVEVAGSFKKESR